MKSVCLSSMGSRPITLWLALITATTAYADSNLPDLPLLVQDGRPYLEGVTLGMHVDQVREILSAAGYSAIAGKIVVDYRKGNAQIQVGRNPEIPLKSINFQVASQFDRADVELNFKQKQQYIDRFQSLFPDNSTCRLTRNINAHAFCKYQVMHLGKLKYRVVLEIKNTSIQIKYAGS